ALRKFCVLTLLQFHGNTSSITAKLCLVSTQNLLANHSCSIMRYCLNYTIKQHSRQYFTKRSVSCCPASIIPQIDGRPAAERERKVTNQERAIDFPLENGYRA
ncbi:hypothetical protein, partial [Agathobaculum sp.]